MVYLNFYPYKKNNIHAYIKKNLLTLTIILILFFEWFYNHPSLRYGGYCLVASFLFLVFSFKIENTKYEVIKIKKKIAVLILITLLIFLGRNMMRIFDEHDQYSYKPLIDVFYNFDDRHFDIQNKMENIIKDYKDCMNKNCNDQNDIGIKEKFNTYVFYKK